MWVELWLDAFIICSPTFSMYFPVTSTESFHLTDAKMKEENKNMAINGSSANVHS